MNKLIKLSDTHYIVVDDTEIKEGDFDYSINYKTVTYVDNERFLNHSLPAYKGLYKKITHSTKPLVHPNCCLSKEGITNMNKGCSERNRCLGNIQIIPLSEVEEAVYGYSTDAIVQNHFKDYWKKEDGSEIRGEEISAEMMSGMLCETSAFLSGFKAHQELFKDVLFTEEEVVDCMFKAIDIWMNNMTENSSQITGPEIQNIIKPFLPKTEWDIEFDKQGKIRLI